MQSRHKFLMGLVTFTIVLRLLPYVLTAYDYKIDSSVMFYPWNFMPLTGLCLYTGAYITDRRWSMGLPLLALLISDLGIWALTGQFSWAFPSDRWSVYVCYLITVLMGTGLNQRAFPLRTFDAVGRGVLAEVVFFVVTNFAYFCSQTDHPHTVAGLVACYVAAIPFAGKSFMSTILSSTLFFSPLAIRASGESTRSESLVGSAVTR